MMNTIGKDLSGVFWVVILLPIWVIIFVIYLGVYIGVSLAKLLIEYEGWGE